MRGHTHVREVLEHPVRLADRIGVPYRGLSPLLALSLILAQSQLRPTIEPPVRAAEQVVVIGADGRRRDVGSNGDASERIQELIRQLGNPRYHGPPRRRQRAAADRRRSVRSAPRGHRRLRPRSGRQRRYLLRQITVRWVHSDDSPPSVRCLRDYGQQHDEPAPAPRSAAWPSLPNGEGIAGLVPHRPFRSLAARFATGGAGDHSAGGATDANGPPIDPDVVDHELGTSTRRRGHWLRQYLVQLRDPAASVAAWQALDRRRNRRGSKPTPTTPRPKSSAACSGTWPSCIASWRSPADWSARRSHDRACDADGIGRHGRQSAYLADRE